MIRKGQKVEITGGHADYIGLRGVAQERFQPKTWIVETENGKKPIVHQDDLSPLKQPARRRNLKANRSTVDAALAGADLLAEEPTDALYRVIWKEDLSKELHPNDPELVGLDSLGKGVNCLHVTREPEAWYRQLREDYDRDGVAYLVAIDPIDGDRLADDPQQVAPSELFGRTLDSQVLITSREWLTRGRDFSVVGKYQYHRGHDEVRFTEMGNRGARLSSPSGRAC